MHYFKHVMKAFGGVSTAGMYCTENSTAYYKCRLL